MIIMDPGGKRRPMNTAGLTGGRIPGQRRPAGGTLTFLNGSFAVKNESPKEAFLWALPFDGGENKKFYKGK